ncbi:MAG: hypothetical protein ACXV74_03375 [Methylobacter sp.]
MNTAARGLLKIFSGKKCSPASTIKHYLEGVPLLSWTPYIVKEFVRLNFR